MAAIFYNIANTDSTIFRGGLTVNNSVTIPLLTDLIGPDSMIVINEVTMQNRETIQYFLTFDDLVSYFYFGKGLGSVSISGSIFSDCGDNDSDNFNGIDDLILAIEDNRGLTWKVIYGTSVFTAVLSSFTLRSNANDMTMNIVDFSLQMEIIDHDLKKPNFKSVC